jgi:hypothetical protein
MIASRDHPEPFPDHDTPFWRSPDLGESERPQTSRGAAIRLVFGYHFLSA